MPGARLVLGGADFRTGSGLPALSEAHETLDLVHGNGITEIDTAQGYGDSEERLGSLNVGLNFEFDTKAPGGFVKGSLNPNSLVSGVEASLKRLHVKQINIFYIHAPDPTVPLGDWIPAIDQLYRGGAFKRFGLSNFTADEVREVHGYCLAHNYVLPSILQSSYSAIARLAESALVPLLRGLGMSFYAYSPLAGGFLTKTKQDFVEGVGKGRFLTTTDMGRQYREMFHKTAYLDALAVWEALAADTGCDRAELALRWVVHNSILDPDMGDAVILGVSSLGHAQSALRWIQKGPLGAGTVQEIDEIWETVKHEAVLDAHHRRTTEG